MARRATYFFDVRESVPHAMMVSGGWEYLPTTEGDAPAAPQLRQLAKAFEYLEYDVAFIGREEQQRLAELGVTPEKIRRSAEEEPITIRITPDEHRIGFIRLPSLPDGEHIPSPELVRQIAEIVKRERASTDLLVGLSDWGWVGEREYIGQSPEFMPDILLGSGLGSGAVGRMDDNRRCSWNRPYEKGKTVIEVQLFAWPDRSKPSAWEAQDTIQSISIGLGDKYLDNPDVDALFQ